MTLVPDPDDVLELFLGFWISRTVMAAVDLGVFDVLDGEPSRRGLTLHEVRARLGLAVRPARALLDMCVASGLLAKADGRYREHDAGLPVSGGPFGVLPAELCPRRAVVLAGLEPAGGRPPSRRAASAGGRGGLRRLTEEFFLDFLHGHSLARGERLAAHGVRSERPDHNSRPQG